MRTMHEIKEKLTKEVDKIAAKGEISSGSLDALHKLTDTIKNIDKIMMLEEDGHSGADWEARGSYDGGMSSRRGRRGYSRDDGMSSYDGGESYARRGMHYVRGHYSRHDGRAKMMEQLEEMMESADSEKDRDAIRRCMSQMEKA